MSTVALHQKYRPQTLAYQNLSLFGFVAIQLR